MSENQQNVISETDIKKGFESLSTLAQEEYHEPLLAVASDVGVAVDRRVLRVGRLMGVLMKQPFAHSDNLPSPSAETGAYRAWYWEADRFVDPSNTSLWQYQLIEQLRQEFAYFAPEEMAERGFFGTLASSLRKYLCGDPAMTKRLEAAAAELQRQGSAAGGLTPQVLMGSAGTALATSLALLVPWLAACAPIIAGLVVIIGTVGLDAFCTWKETHVQE